MASADRADDPVWDRYVPLLTLIARRLLTIPAWARGKVAASDIVQETLAVAVRRRDDWQALPDGQRTGWLVQTLRNVALGQLRDLGRQRRDARLERSLCAYVDGVSDWFERELAGSDLPPDRSAERREELLRLAEAVARLPDRLRQVFEMRELDGLTYREIAAELGLTTGQVAGLLRDARRQLRRRLEGADG